MNNSIVKVGIVDDHSIVRSGLRQFLSEMVDLRVVGEAASGREAGAQRSAVAEILAVADHVQRRHTRTQPKNFSA